MAKKKPTGRKRQKVALRRTVRHLSVDVKVGILHTIADAIYSTPAGKIREAVANARDNGASWVVIIVDRATRSLFIIDNGSGITQNRFYEIFESIGYGLLRDEREKKLSYFGLGLMSIFQLGNRVHLFTHPSATNQMYKLEVNTEEIFSKKNEKKSISSLKTFISLSKSDERERRAASVSLMNQILGERPFENGWNSFTEIIIEDINAEELNTICEDGFVDELRKWLPLKAEKDEPFLKRISGKKGKKIRAMLDNQEFCKTVDVYFGVQEDARIDQLSKYFPHFRSDISFPDDNVYVEKSENDDFAYYILHTVAVDLQRGTDVGGETGFWIRNQNFLVKSADFLERPGPGRKIKTIDQPLKAWVFGEIFHKDMNYFLTVSRNDFLFDKEGFKKFQEEIVDIVSPLNQELRSINEKKRKIVEGLVTPFSQLRGSAGPIQETEKRLRKITQYEGSDENFKKDMFARLKKVRNREIEREESRVDILLRQSRSGVTLGEDEDALVRIDPGLRGKIEDCEVTWDAKNGRVVASLSPDLFEPKEVVFLGEGFTLVFVAEKEQAPGVSIDVDDRKIYVNPFNRELADYTVSIFDVYLALQIAKAISSTPDELVKNALALLGAKSEVTNRYITPLGDDLRRTLELSRRGI